MSQVFTRIRYNMSVRQASLVSFDEAAKFEVAGLVGRLNKPAGASVPSSTCRAGAEW